MRVNPLFYNLLVVPSLGLARRSATLARRVAGRVQRDWQDRLQTPPRFRPPDVCAGHNPPVGELHSYFPPCRWKLLRPHAEWIAELSANFADGEFDLLGSGWTAVHYGMDCRGLAKATFTRRWPLTRT